MIVSSSTDANDASTGPLVRHRPRVLRAGMSSAAAASGSRPAYPQPGQAHQRLDDVETGGVDAAQDREVERDEVAEQHERDDPLEPRLAAARTRSTSPRPPPRSPRSARCAGARARGPPGPRGTRPRSGRSPAAGPADDLVVVDLGQLAGERGHLGVLVDLRLPAVGGRGGEAGARRSPGSSRRRRARQAPWPRCPRPRRAPTRGELERRARRRRRPRRAATARRRTARRPRARRPASSRPPRAAGSRRRAGPPARRRARRCGELAAGGGDDARRPASLAAS